MKKIIEKFKTKYLMFFIPLALLIVVIVVFSFKRNLEEVTLENHDFYQYLSATRFDYKGSLKLNHDGNITELVFDDVTVTLDSTPLYYLQDQKVLFPKSMVVVYPISGAQQYKVNYFSTVSFEGSSLYIKDGKMKKELSNSFLYDGNDLYIFIEQTKVSVAGKEYVLSPLSYVIVRYNDSIEIYDKTKNDYKVISIGDEEIIATTDNYSINLSIDAVNYNNKARLLMKKTDFLKNLE